jgi:hypothetical protein
MASFWWPWSKLNKSVSVALLEASIVSPEELALQRVEKAVADLELIVSEYRSLQSQCGLAIDPAGTILRCMVSDFAERDALEVKCRDLARRHDVALQNFYRCCSVYAGSKIERRN